MVAHGSCCMSKGQAAVHSNLTHLDPPWFSVRCACGRLPLQHVPRARACAATLLIRRNSFHGDDPLGVNAGWVICEAFTLLSVRLSAADQYLLLNINHTVCSAPAVSMKRVQAYINATCLSGGHSATLALLGFTLQARLCATSLGGSASQT